MLILQIALGIILAGAITRLFRLLWPLVLVAILIALAGHG